MRYRVDLSGWRLVKATVEVEAADSSEATYKAEDAGRKLAPFVWEIDEHDDVVHSICTDHIEELEDK